MSQKKGFNLQASDLSHRIKDIPVTAPNPGDIQQVRVEDIVVLPQVRERFDPVALRNLMEAIKRDGQRQPLECYFEDGKHYLLTGERRYRAVKKLGWSLVEVKIRKKPEPAEAIYLQISENEDREPLTRIEMAKAIQALCAGGEPTKQVAKQLRINEKQVPRFRTVGRASERVHALYDEGIVDIRSLELMAHIDESWTDAFEELARAVVSGDVGRSELESIYARLKKGEAVETVVSVSTQTAVPANEDQGAVDPAKTDGSNDPQAASGVPEGAEAPSRQDDPANRQEGASGGEEGGSAPAPGSSGDAPKEPKSSAKQDKAGISIDHHYEPTHVESDPGSIVIEVKGKLDNGALINGTLLMDRVDEQSEYVWVKPDSQDAPAVKLPAKKVKVVSVTAV